MTRRFCYGVREDGSYSPSILVWATDARSAMNIARQTGANVTGAREIVPSYAWAQTFNGGRDTYGQLPDELVIHGGGEGFYHRYRGKVYRMNEYGTFFGCSQTQQP